MRRHRIAQLEIRVVSIRKKDGLLSRVQTKGDCFGTSIEAQHNSPVSIVDLMDSRSSRAKHNVPNMKLVLAHLNGISSKCISFVASRLTHAVESSNLRPSACKNEFVVRIRDSFHGPIAYNCEDSLFAVDLNR